MMSQKSSKKDAANTFPIDCHISTRFNNGNDNAAQSFQKTIGGSRRAFLLGLRKTVKEAFLIAIDEQLENYKEGLEEDGADYWKEMERSMALQGKSWETIAVNCMVIYKGFLVQRTVRITESGFLELVASGAKIQEFSTLFESDFIKEFKEYIEKGSITFDEK